MANVNITTEIFVSETVVMGCKAIIGQGQSLEREVTSDVVDSYAVTEGCREKMPVA